MKTFPLPHISTRHILTHPPKGFTVTNKGYETTQTGPKSIPFFTIERHRNGTYSTYSCDGFAKRFPNLSSAITFIRTSISLAMA